jgi:hypothetical protein
VEPGRYLLTYDVAWKHGRVAWDAEGTLESARFAFPIEIVDDAAPTDAQESSSPDAVTITLNEDRTVLLTVRGLEYPALTTDVIDDRVTIDVPAGTRVEVEPGDAVDWEANVMVARSGNQLGPGVPRLPFFEGTVLWFWSFELPDGRTVREHFVVELMPDVSDDVASEVLRIRCREGRATLLTPVVETTPDGVQVLVIPQGAPIPIEFRELGSDGWFGGDVDADGRSHPWPIRPGMAEVDCGPDAWEFEDSATFEVVDPSGHWADPELACSETERAEVVGYDGGAAEWVDETAAIGGILRGVEPDEVRLPAYRGVKDARWVVVRDGHVIGTVWYEPVTDGSDARGGGLGRVTGEVCAGSGIEGSVPPRDPDEDGVDLDCTAASQVVFQHRGGYLLPLGETYIRANVSGIRGTDELVPPANGGGEHGYDGIWRVEREGKTVASIVYPSLDGITCRWNAIGAAGRPG